MVSTLQRGGQVLSLLAVVAVTASPAADAVAQHGTSSDRAALEALYDAAGGASWKDATNWLTSAPLGAWRGVTTDADGRVTGLALDRNGLAGSIPGELGDLLNLEELHLGDNVLTGPIPAELGRLVNLRKLNLPGNELIGPIPAELGRLVNLQGLFLQSNDGLTGPIPAALGNLGNLRELYLNSYRLTGPIPAALGNLVSLRVLSLGGSNLAGPIPRELGRLVNLRWLWLSNLGLTGPIPGELGNLVNLEILDLGDNALTGPIPGELGNLVNLARMSLPRNALTGPVPGALESLVNLQSLDLSYNWDLSGPIPSGLQLPRLEVLNMAVTQACAPAHWKDWMATLEFIAPPCDAGADVVIDVAVVYSPGARASAGGTAEIEAEIDLMIAETNQAYAASGVHLRVFLVERSEVPYDETGDAGFDLTRLAAPSDGYMDEVHALRDRVGADLVHFIVGESLDVCGVANVVGPFALTVQGCGGLTFAHEIGHNMGLLHDRYVEHRGGGLSAHPAFGYVNQPAFEAGSARSRRWRTIMAYDKQCSDAGFFCSPLLRFSNPQQRDNGDPLGVTHVPGWFGVTGPADAAAVLNATGRATARWRDRPAAGDANRPPATAAALPDRILAPHRTLDVDVAGAFFDPDGDALTYAVSSTAPDAVTVGVTGTRVTLTAVGTGTAAIWVTAADPGGLTAMQPFMVTVLPNRAPEPVGVLAPVTIAVGGTPVEVDVADAFQDADGDPLTYRASSSAPSVAAVLVSGSRVTLTAVSAGTATVTVTAIDVGGSNTPATQTFPVKVPVPFVDDPLVPGVTAVKAVHFEELRARIAALRRAAGLGRFPWTDPVLRPGVTPVRLAHLLDLREALTAAYAASGQAAPRWTDAAPVGGTTPIRVAHVTELRAAVTALE